MRAAASERSRGRQPVFSDDELERASQFAYAKRVRSRRGAQDLVYRKFAIAVIELYCEGHPEDAGPLGWLLRPVPRYSLLTELGRIGKPRSGDEDELEWTAPAVSRLIRTAVAISFLKPSTKVGVAMIRDHRRRFQAEVA